jgi:hypothetical protein
LATLKKGKVAFSFFMSDVNPKTKANKVSTVEYFVLPAAVTAYNAAADDAARAATTVGVLQTALENLTLGILKEVSVGFAYAQNLAPPAPDTFAFAFDKFLQSSRDVVTSRAVTTTIPARDDADIVIESDGVTIDISMTDYADFVAAYEAIVLSDDSNAVQVIRASITS